MKKILVSIGYGRFAHQYFGYAQQLAHYFDANISLIHIYNDPNAINEFPEDFDDVSHTDQVQLTDEDYQSSELERLNKFSKQYGLMEFEHIKVDCMVIEGDIEIELVQLIDNNNFDLLVMGMRKHRLRDQLFGNLVQKVIDDINIPTLLIPPKANIRLVQDIVYATAFDPGTVQTVEYLLDWCRAFNSTITLAHVSILGKKEDAKANLINLSDQFHEEKKAGVLSTKLLYGNVHSALNDFIVRANSDILVIHKRKLGFWATIMSGNLSVELTERLNIPLLVLRNISKGMSYSLS